MACPHCRSTDLEFDLVSDDLIHLSFWVCPGCGRRGIVRIVDRKPAPPVSEHPRATLAGHMPRRVLRESRDPRRAA